MSEELTRIEQDFMKISNERRLILLLADSGVGQLAREVKRSRQADESSPHSMAIRVSLAADAVEKVEKATAFLADVSQKLVTLQQEQLNNL